MLTTTSDGAAWRPSGRGSSVGGSSVIVAECTQRGSAAAYRSRRSQDPAKSGEIPALTRNGEAPPRDGTSPVAWPCVRQPDPRGKGGSRWTLPDFLSSNLMEDRCEDASSAGGAAPAHLIARRAVAATTTTSRQRRSDRRRDTTAPRRSQRRRPSAAGDRTVDGARSTRRARIVSLSPTHTEMLFAIGAGDQVVAVDSLSNYPPEAADVVTDLSAYEPNVEADRRLRARPRRHRRHHRSFVTQLDALGLALWVGPAPRLRRRVRPDRAARRATGHVGEAAELVGQMQPTSTRSLAGLPHAGGAADLLPRARQHVLHASPRTRSSARCTTCVGLRNIADEAEGDSGLPAAVRRVHHLDQTPT